MKEDYKNQPSNPDEVSYLLQPPEVIDVSVGRQLFVDDFLIETTSLMREYHQAKKFEGNPILKPETEWEKDGLPVACPKSGGVWYDEEEHKFKMWYEAGWLRYMCYATSEDGIHWDRPDLLEVEHTNIILPYEGYEPHKYTGDISYLRPDSTTVWIDYTADKQEKYKLFLRNPGGNYEAILATSADGIHFENYRFTNYQMGDRSTCFYNPFRQKWVYSLRKLIFPEGNLQRVRYYHESDDFLDVSWEKDDKVLWLSTDENNWTGITNLARKYVSVLK